MNKLSVIIVNFNTKDLLNLCINNLLDFAIPTEIIVVDNGSVDGSQELVESDYKNKVTLIKTENNGLAAGYNLGYKASTGDYLLYLGTDAYPKEDAVKQIVDYMEAHANVGAATARLVLRDGSVDMDAHRGFPTPLTSLFHFSRLNKLFPNSPVINKYFLAGNDLNTIHEVDVCIAHFMLVKRTVQEKVGLWDQSFFVYGEDVDFCYRIKEAGFKIMYMGNVEVLHFKGATVGRKATSDLKNVAKTTDVVKKRIPMETTRAMKLFYEKHYKNKYPFVVNFLVLSGISVLEKARVLLSHK
jgi:GT2 family glycosyltransferase